VTEDLNVTKVAHYLPMSAEAGRRYVDPSTDEVAEETRILPLLVPMPEEHRAVLLAEETS